LQSNLFFLCKLFVNITPPPPPKKKYFTVNFTHLREDIVVQASFPGNTVGWVTAPYAKYDSTDVSAKRALYVSTLNMKATRSHEYQHLFSTLYSRVQHPVARVLTEFSLMFTSTVRISIHFHFLYLLFLHYMFRPM
jgi:hypothetical protein